MNDWRDNWASPHCWVCQWITGWDCRQRPDWTCDDDRLYDYYVLMMEKSKHGRSISFRRHHANRIKQRKLSEWRQKRARANNEFCHVDPSPKELGIIVNSHQPAGYKCRCERCAFGRRKYLGGSGRLSRRSWRS